MTRIGLISDTHAPRYWKAMPATVARALDGVDLILHAGDVCTAAVLADLATLAPVRVALGNNDGPDVVAAGALAELRLVVEGLAIAVVHDSGPATGRMRRLRRRFPDDDLVVFGHSHIPWHERYEGQTAVNPGSPTDRRRQPFGTVAIAEVSDGALRGVRAVRVT